MEDIEVPEPSDIEDITFRRWTRTLQEEVVPTSQTQNIVWVDEEEDGEKESFLQKLRNTFSKKHSDFKIPGCSTTKLPAAS